MSSYIHFTEEQKARARQADLAELLRRQGEQLKRSGKEYDGGTVLPKLPSGEICGFTNMNGSEGMRLILCGGSIAKTIRKRWNSCSAAAWER